MSKLRKLAQVFRLRRKLVKSETFWPFIGTTPTGDKFDELVDTVWSQMPSPTPESAVRQSLEPMAGQPFTKETLHDMCWRLAGNYDRLKAGVAVPPWTIQRTDELVPVQVIEAYPTVTRFGEMGTRLVCRVLAGTMCPMILETVWTAKRAHFRSRIIGFSAPWGKYPYEHPMQLVGLRMTVLIEAKNSAEKPYFDIGVDKEPSAILAYNRKLLKMRKRIGFSCPGGYVHPCHLCPIGYDKCPAATHPITYEAKPCPKCEKTGWFDPAKPRQKICTDCYYNNLLKDRYGGRQHQT